MIIAAQGVEGKMTENSEGGERGEDADVGLGGGDR